jgi:hypothetical protein
LHHSWFRHSSGQLNDVVEGAVEVDVNVAGTCEVLQGFDKDGVTVAWPLEPVTEVEVCAAEEPPVALSDAAEVGGTEEPSAELSDAADDPGPVDAAVVSLVLLGAEESDPVTAGAVPSMLLDEVEKPREDVVWPSALLRSGKDMLKTSDDPAA